MSRRPSHIPAATYRLQLSRAFTFQDAAALVGYLVDLGISHVYTSPVFRARAGSSHGYDVVEHGVLSPELGGEEGFLALSRALQARGMGLILDLVPNHMCVATPENRWWADVLENGPASPFATYFDIDWHPPKADLHEKVLLPFLGDQFGRVLESGQLRLVAEGGSFWVIYGEHRFAVAPKSLPAVLRPVRDALCDGLGPAHPHTQELASILTALDHLPPRSERDPARLEERRREKEVVKRRLDDLLAASAEARASLEATMAAINGQPGDPASFDPLEKLLLDQGYRLSHWRVAADEINYRRFFDINDLAALRVEQAEVFAALHALPIRLLQDGVVAGFRIDHVDGLVDPAAYLQNLPEDAYVVVEKILTGDERLPTDWRAHGTTGYEYLNSVNAVFVDPQGMDGLWAAYEDFTSRRTPLADVVYESKKLVLEVALSSELTVLARRLDRISEQHRHSRDFTLSSLQTALAEVIACFPVYRSYVRPDGSMGAQDRRHILAAVASAKRRNRGMSASIFEFLASVLLLHHPPALGAGEQATRCDFVVRFQQLTSAVMAKGLEDTAFYRVRPLASLCAVGAPGHLAHTDSRERFHLENSERLHAWPHGLSATSTHDTKQDEDVRARLDILSEMPDRWRDALDRCSAIAGAHKTVLDDGTEAPDPHDEYLFYKAAIGAWPLGGPEPAARAHLIDRLQEYVAKAMREAKIHTSWVSPNEPYERAVRRFVAAALADSADNELLRVLGGVIEAVTYPGLLTAVSQTLLKIASPGVPDFYQGTELPDFRLVDPDNRQPVDFGIRRHWLDQVRADASRDPVGLAGRLMHDLDGRLKLLVIHQALAFRSSHLPLFERGDYVALGARGALERHVVAFARRSADAAAVAVTARFFAHLPRPPIGGAVWGDTFLLLSGPEAAFVYRDALTGQIVAVQEGPHGPELPLDRVLRHLPVALLEREA